MAPWRRAASTAAVAIMGLVVLSGCGGVTMSSLEQRATGSWACTVRFGEDTADVAAEIDSDGTFTLTADGGDQIEGTWDRSGDQVSIESDSPFMPAFTYEGATDDPEEISVVESDGVSGVFDVEIDGARVLFTQTEYGDGEPADPDYPVSYACEKQAG